METPVPRGAGPRKDAISDMVHFCILGSALCALDGNGPQIVTGMRGRTGCVNKLFTPSEPRPNTLKSLTHDWDCFLDAIQTFPNLVVIILVKYGVSL